MKSWTNTMMLTALFAVAAVCLGDDEPSVGTAQADQLDVELTLPPVVHSLPGLETNIYFENTVLMINPANVVFDVDCSKGIHQQERWTFTPAADDVGDYPLTLKVIDQANRTIASAETVVRVAAPDAHADLSMLMIGDSLTHASIYPARVAELAEEDDDMALRFVGTHAPKKEMPTLRHEGYGGWTAVAFTTRYDEEDWKNGRRARSPFVFAAPDGQPAFDFERYCREENDGTPPDIVTILLGCNDTFGANEEGQADAISRSLENVDILIDGIRKTGPDTIIGILLLAPPAGTQDAFGANYRCGQTRWQYRRNQHRYVQQTIGRYGNREADGIYLLPTNVILDPHGGFPARETSTSAHSDTRVTRLANGVHPSAVGYRQMGDTVYSWLKSVARD